MVAIPNLITTVAGLASLPGPGSSMKPRDQVLSNVTMPLSSAQQSALGSPSTPLSAVGIGFGVQNYTCSADNVFVAAGAVAEIFNITSLANTNTSLLSNISNEVFGYWNGSSDNTTIQQIIDSLPKYVPADTILAQHYFIGNETGGLSPVWDFRATEKFKGDDDAVFVGKVLANASDADPTKNVPWLHLGKVSGNISDEVYRIFTVGGVAPSSCVNGTEDISVKYASQYWFYGGSLGLGSNDSLANA